MVLVYSIISSFPVEWAIIIVIYASSGMKRPCRSMVYHQVEDGLMRHQECDRMRFIVGKSWDLKLQIHLLEKGCTQLAGVIAHIISWFWLNFFAMPW